MPQTQNSTTTTTVTVTTQHFPTTQIPIQIQPTKTNLKVASPKYLFTNDPLLIQQYQSHSKSVHKNKNFMDENNNNIYLEQNIFNIGNSENFNNLHDSTFQIESSHSRFLCDNKYDNMNDLTGNEEEFVLESRANDDEINENFKKKQKNVKCQNHHRNYYNYSSSNGTATQNSQVGSSFYHDSVNTKQPFFLLFMTGI